jgi:hypothetical protein
MMRQRLGLISGLAIGGILSAAWWVGAGELSPAPGPIVPTMKSLDTVEPRTAIFDIAGSTISINASGSYYLAEELVATNIQINAGNVTIDLNGFGLVNAPGPSAIQQTTGEGTTIRNGRIMNPLDTGINLSSGRRQLIESVVVISSANSGIVVGESSTVKNCLVLQSVSNGIEAGLGSRIIDCVSRNNSSAGISVGNYSVVSGCTSTLNGGAGIQLGVDCIATNCVSETNVGHCICGGDGCVVSSCSATGSSGGDGIHVVTTSVVRGCIARSNANTGIHVGNNGLIHGCTAAGNGTDVVLSSQAKCRDTVTGDLHPDCP